MKGFCTGVFFFAWALWFGGTVAILLFVQRLFHDDRSLALMAAPRLFLVFEKYQILLAITANISLAGSDSGRWRRAITPLALIAALIAVISAFGITPRIEHLRLIGEEHSPAFRTLHGVSMVIYLAQVLILFSIGVILHRQFKGQSSAPQSFSLALTDQNESPIASN